jgi:hypothetical protein
VDRDLVRVLAALTDDEFNELVSEARSQDNSVEAGQERAVAAVRDFVRGR